MPPTTGEDAFARTNVVRVVTWPSPRLEDEGVTSLPEVLVAELPWAHGWLGAELGTHQALRMPLLDFEKV